MSRIPEAAIKKIQELKADAEKMDKMATNRKIEGGQIGISIPRHFFAGDTFTINPSSISPGMLVRMMETDETILAAVEFKILMLVSKIGDYYHENQEIKDHVNDFLKKLRRPSWIEALEAMASSYGVGYSITEIVYGLDKAMRKVPTRLATYHPSTIAFETDVSGQITEDGVLQFVEQSLSENGNPNERAATVRRRSVITNPFTTPVDRALPIRLPFFNNWGMVRIRRDKVIHHVNKSFLSFGSPYGKSAVRTAHLAWQMKLFFMKHLGVAGKRNSTPTIVGYAPSQSQVMVELTLPDGTKKQMTPANALSAMLAERESNDSLVTGSQKDGYKLEVLSNQASLDQFLNVINEMNTYIFRAFLMPSLILTDGSGGNRALGEKHFDIVNRIAEIDAKKFCGAIIYDMIEPTIVDNFGEQDDYGKFQQRPASLEELERLSNVYSNITMSGYMSPDNKKDFEFVRESVGAPEGEMNLFGDTDENGDDEL